MFSMMNTKGVDRMIKVTVVTFPRLGYPGGEDQPVYSTTLVNLSSILYFKVNGTNPKYAKSKMMNVLGKMYEIKESCDEIISMISSSESSLRKVNDRLWLDADRIVKVVVKTSAKASFDAAETYFTDCHPVEFVDGKPTEMARIPYGDRMLTLREFEALGDWYHVTMDNGDVVTLTEGEFKKLMGDEK